MGGSNETVDALWMTRSRSFGSAGSAPESALDHAQAVLDRRLDARLADLVAPDREHGLVEQRAEAIDGRRRALLADEQRDLGARVVGQQALENRLAEKAGAAGEEYVRFPQVDVRLPSMSRKKLTGNGFADAVVQPGQRRDLGLDLGGAGDAVLAAEDDSSRRTDGRRRRGRPRRSATMQSARVLRVSLTARGDSSESATALVVEELLVTLLHVEDHRDRGCERRALALRGQAHIGGTGDPLVDEARGRVHRDDRHAEPDGGHGTTDRPAAVRPPPSGACAPCPPAHPGTAAGRWPRARHRARRRSRTSRTPR